MKVDVAEFATAPLVIVLLPDIDLLIGLFPFFISQHRAHYKGVDTAKHKDLGEDSTNSNECTEKTSKVSKEVQEIVNRASVAFSRL